MRERERCALRSCMQDTLADDDTHLSYVPLAHIFETMVECALLANGACIGFYSGNIKLIQEDILALKPTIFCGVPRIYQRFYERACQKINLYPGCIKSLLNTGLAAEMQAVGEPKTLGWS